MAGKLAALTKYIIEENDHRSGRRQQFRIIMSHRGPLTKKTQSATLMLESLSFMEWLMENDTIKERKYVGKDYQDVMELPGLIDIQTRSYEKFLQADKISGGENPLAQGLEEAFRVTFPIKSQSEDMVLDYEYYTLDQPKFSEMDCKQKGLTFAVSLKARINLIFQETGEIRQKDIYFGDIPVMTDRGTFIINGAERVVVSQIHRSPGVVFSHEKGVFSSRIIPYRGSWLEFEVDQKRELLYTKIDRKKRILGTIFLRALGFSTREDIIRAFYKTKKVTIEDSAACRALISGAYLAAPFMNAAENDAASTGDGDGGGGPKKLYPAGDEKLREHNVDEFLAHGVTEVELVDFEAEGSLRSNMLFACFEREKILWV